MFAHDFVRNAFLAGTFIALACGSVGWLVVLRAQVFAGDALSHVAFVGAIAAAAIGIDERVGLFAATIAVAVGIGALGRRGRADDVEIGIVFAWVLGIGALLLMVLSTSSAGGNGVAGVNTLFGSIYSLSASASRIAAAAGIAVAATVLFAFRPLLLATLDGELAALRGVPVRLLGIAFLVLVAIVTAESTPAIGALLLLGLISAPAGAAHRLTARPYQGLALSAVLAVLCTWAGLTLSYAVPALPPSTAIIGFAGAAYALASARSGWRAARRR